MVEPAVDEFVLNSWGEFLINDDSSLRLHSDGSVKGCSDCNCDYTCSTSGTCEGCGVQDDQKSPSSLSSVFLGFDILSQTWSNSCLHSANKPGVGTVNFYYGRCHQGCQLMYLSGGGCSWSGNSTLVPYYQGTAPTYAYEVAPTVSIQFWVSWDSAAKVWRGQIWYTYLGNIYILARGTTTQSVCCCDASFTGFENLSCGDTVAADEYPVGGTWMARPGSGGIMSTTPCSELPSEYVSITPCTPTGDNPEDGQYHSFFDGNVSIGEQGNAHVNRNQTFVAEYESDGVTPKTTRSCAFALVGSKCYRKDSVIGLALIAYIGNVIKVMSYIQNPASGGSICHTICLSVRDGMAQDCTHSCFGTMKLSCSGVSSPIFPNPQCAWLDAEFPLFLDGPDFKPTDSLSCFTIEGPFYLWNADANCELCDWEAADPPCEPSCNTPPGERACLDVNGKILRSSIGGCTYVWLSEDPPSEGALESYLLGFNTSTCEWFLETLSTVCDPAFLPGECFPIGFTQVISTKSGDPDPTHLGTYSGGEIVSEAVCP